MTERFAPEPTLISIEAAAVETHVGDRLHALTGLRIFAALAVYFAHVGAPAGAPEFIATAFSSGYYGVTFFFTLSGFVLAINYFNALRRPTGRRLWSYGIARLARIYPLYIVVLLYTGLAARHSGTNLGGVWIEHALVLQAWDPDMRAAFSYNGPAWSISVEVFLYATLPLLIPVIARRDGDVRSLLVAATTVAAVMVAIATAFTLAGLSGLPWSDPSSAHRWLYRSPIFRLGDFVLGIIAARLYLQLRGRANSDRLGGRLIFVALLATALFATRAELLHSAASWDVGYALPAFALLLGLALAPGNIVARFLAFPIVVLLGEVSYAFYLVHIPALAAIGPSGWSNKLSIGTIAIQSFQLATILVIAIGLHYLIEKPARTWLRQVLAARH